MAIAAPLLCMSCHLVGDVEGWGFELNGGVGGDGSGGEATTTGPGAAGGGDASGGDTATGSAGNGGASIGSGGTGGSSGDGGSGGAGGPCGPGQTEVAGTCYAFIATETTWPGAIAGCAGDGGYLAVLGTLAEFNALISSGVIPPTGPVGPWGITWVGGIDYGGTNQFSWHNGEPWVFANNVVPVWKHVQEPNDMGSNESCTDLYAYDGAGGVGLNDEACNSPRPYLCEYDPQ